MSRSGMCASGFAVLALSLAGCGLWPPPLLPGPRLNGDAYTVGSPDGPLADDLRDHLQLVDHDGISANGPMLITPEVITQPVLQEALAIRAAYDLGHPMALVQPGPAEVAALHAILGVSASAYGLPEDVGEIEIYAIDREPDGSVFQRVQFAPTEEAMSAGLVEQYNEDDTMETDPLEEVVVAIGDDDEAQSIRAAAFARWLEEDGTRMDKPLAQAAKLRARQQAASQNLPDIAKAWVLDVNYTLMKANYQISHFVWGCHSLNTGDDWFLMQQWCVFSAKNAMTNWAGKHKGRYLDEIELDAWLAGYDNNPSAVRMMQSSPETANNQTSITSGVSYNLGGEVAIDGPKVSGGISIESSTTVAVSDCTVYNISNDRQNNAHWLYKFRRCDAAGTWKSHLSNPPALATTTFQPVNQWIWRMPATTRAAAPVMQVHFRPQLVDTELDYYFFAYRIKHHWWWYDLYFYVKFPFPPMTQP